VESHCTKQKAHMVDIRRQTAGKRVVDEKKYIITIDGGTTNTRVYLWTKDGINIDSRSDGTGVRDTAADGNNQRLKNAVREMLTSLTQENGIAWETVEAVYASGMITSDVGLFELPHLIAPAGLKDFSQGVKTVLLEEVCPKPVCFIPGLKNRKDEEISLDNLADMDMMRGEEVEALALLSDWKIREPALLILPGSHTKMIAADSAGRLLCCLTSMTGEILELLTKHSIVAGAVDREYLKESPDKEYLLAGYRYARDTGSFGRTAFLTRISSQFVSGEIKKCASFLLGAVLENDVAAIESSQMFQGFQKSRVLIAGKEPLSSALAYLLEQDNEFKEVSVLSYEKNVPLSGKGALLIHEERNRRNGIIRQDQGE
jgi:2-dehydro-3-deoxygalactonokinase